MKEITELRAIQKICVGILEQFAKFCDDNNIKYYLSWGTLLGAVRHKGFIPWDDDIDVMMMRNDYEKFCAIAKSGINNNIDVFLPLETPNYYFPNIRISDNRTYIKFNNLKNDAKHGIFVTIFPIDKLPDNKFLRKLYIIRSNLYCSVLYNLLSEKVKGATGFRTFLKHMTRIFCPSSSIKKVAVKADLFFKKYKNINNQYFSILTTGTSKKCIFRKEIFLSSNEVEYERCKHPAPAGYDEFLKVLYDDYMTFPPVEKRTPKHDYIAYWK